MIGSVDGTILFDVLPHMDAGPDRTADTLQARSLASVFWLTLQNLLAAVLLVAIPAVLARLLTPEDLGLLEIALAFFGLATLFMELGTGPAIIQRPAVDATFLSTVFGVNVATGAVFALILIVGAPAITEWLRMDVRLVSVLRWLGVTLIPLSTAIVSRNLLARRLLYRRVTIADAVAGAAATVAAFAVLSRGLDVALTLGFMVYGTIVTIVLWTGVRWWPSARPDLRCCLATPAIQPLRVGREDARQSLAPERPLLDRTLSGGRFAGPFRTGPHPDPRAAPLLSQCV